MHGSQVPNRAKDPLGIERGRQLPGATILVDDLELHQFDGIVGWHEKEQFVGQAVAVLLEQRVPLPMANEREWGVGWSAGPRTAGREWNGESGVHP